MENASIQPSVRNYDWGERGPRAFIPRLLGIRPQKNVPYAELWVDADLPFLIKILTAEKGLSVQAHPNAAQAQAGFRREMSIQSREFRNYKDPNPKNELIIALSEFFMLSDFMTVSQIDKLWSKTPELSFIRRKKNEPLKKFVLRLTEMEQTSVNGILGKLVARLKAKKSYSKNAPEFWLLKANGERCPGTYKDPGLFFFYLLNLLRLKPGSAHFIHSGQIHAHLAGTCIEIMNHSDNVVRAGLTAKRVDIPDLLKISRFNGGEPRLIQRNKQGLLSLPGAGFKAELKFMKNQAESRPRFSAELVEPSSIMLQFCYKKLRTCLKVSC